eukprot:c31865_g1_i1 orf=2-226(-)
MMQKSRSPTRWCKLERVAGWVSYGIYTAFFTSLDRCSCVKLDTIETNNASQPVIISKRHHHHRVPLRASSSSSSS